LATIHDRGTAKGGPAFGRATLPGGEPPHSPAFASGAGRAMGMAVGPGAPNPNTDKHAMASRSRGWSLPLTRLIDLSLKYSRAGDFAVGEASAGEAAWDRVRARQLTVCNTCLAGGMSFDRGVKGQWGLLAPVLASYEGLVDGHGHGEPM
jgi:hypothetical protein